jgi:hypothetical protein
MKCADDTDIAFRSRISGFSFPPSGPSSISVFLRFFVCCPRVAHSFPVSESVDGIAWVG